MSEVKLYLGDCVEVLKTLPDNSVDAVVTDPPYHLVSITKRFGKDGSAPAQYGKDGSFARLSGGFMGKAWDGVDESGNGIAYSVDMWREVLRVLKPGGHLLSFGGTRTYHRMACAIEDAGFEIRDQIQYLYGSGFPKSYNIGKNCEGWDGWGSALKPANEPICLARKPLSEKSIVGNVLKWGTGGINIDGCRIPHDNGVDLSLLQRSQTNGNPDQWRMNKTQNGKEIPTYKPSGRFPANLILDEEAGAMLDEMSGDLKSGVAINHNRKGRIPSVINYANNTMVDAGYPDSGGASRFFYCAKASRSERNAGLEGMEERGVSYMNTHGGNADKGVAWNPVDDRTGVERNRFSASMQNHHPTVKPISLMRYLCRLVTPPNGTVLDPFMGSGTTGCAASLEGFDFIGIEQDAEYMQIAEKRIDHARKQMRLL